ncbi:MAG TPA: hypothetical protein VGU23_04885 [Acidobacteriaceae bacterium]|nr:hypothetical protein [Acidobacteriaceae bacterium]
MKSTEELLSEEVRAAADMGSRTLQWGVTLMISVQTIIFFVRQALLAADIDAGKLPRGGHLSLGRYLIGTSFLLFIAFILSRLNARSIEQYRHYKTQLIASRESGITDLPIKHTGRYLYYLYFAFPVIDVLIRVYGVHIGFS